MSKEWFILQFKANSYRQAIRNLNRQGFETFLPMHENTSQKKCRFTNSTKPLFPSYMFIKFDKTESEWNKINNTYGVIRLVTFNSILKSISTSIVEKLITRCDPSGKLIPVKNFKKGDHVKISRGPFEDFIASVETYEIDHRIWVLIELMGRKTKIQASASDIQPLN
jgi:transcriptional antiterminator RfaH